MRQMHKKWDGLLRKKIKDVDMVQLTNSRIITQTFLNLPNFKHTALILVLGT